jgi:hypothetical protein
LYRTNISSTLNVAFSFSPTRDFRQLALLLTWLSFKYPSECLRPEFLIVHDPDYLCTVLEYCPWVVDTCDKWKTTVIAASLESLFLSCGQLDTDVPHQDHGQPHRRRVGS